MDTRLMVVIVGLIIGLTVTIVAVTYIYNFRIVEIAYVKQRMLHN